MGVLKRAPLTVGGVCSKKSRISMESSSAVMRSLSIATSSSISRTWHPAQTPSHWLLQSLQAAPMLNRHRETLVKCGQTH